MLIGQCHNHSYSPNIGGGRWGGGDIGSQFQSPFQQGFNDGYNSVRQNFGFQNSQDNLGWGNGQYSNGSFNNSFNGGNFCPNGPNQWNNQNNTDGFAYLRQVGNNQVFTNGYNNHGRVNGDFNAVQETGANNYNRINGDCNQLSQQGFGNMSQVNGSGNSVNVMGRNQNMEVCGNGYRVNNDHGRITATDQYGRNRADDAQKFGGDNRIHTEKNELNGKTYIGSQREIDAAERREGVYREPSKGSRGGGIFGNHGATNQINVGCDNQHPGYHPGGKYH